MKGALLMLLTCTVLRADAKAPGHLYGFSGDEIQKVKEGAILSKELKEGSPKELAGVVAIFFRKPVTEIADLLLEAKHLKADESIRDLRVWKPDESADPAFAGLKSEGKTLRARYDSYRKDGLKGAGQSGEELELAIKEALPAERWADFAKALLRYPAESSAGIEHRFVYYRQEVEGQPTFILSHRSARRGKDDALITELRYYVSRTYDCRFIAGDCVGVPGGTLLFYVNCMFTDQVAGMGSGMKHSIGRKRMLASVTASLKDIRERVEKQKT